MFFHRKKFKQGFTLLLSVMILAAVITIGLTVTAILLNQLQFSERLVDAARALMAADSGIEKTLYVDVKSSSPLPTGTTVISSDNTLSPFAAPVASGYYGYSVTATKDAGTGAVLIKSIGVSNQGQRAEQADY